MDSVKLSDIRPNPENPRVIRDHKFKKLCDSITRFPKMLTLRPIIVDKDGMILAGNMRYRALLHLGFKEVSGAWVRRADDLTEAEKKAFIITDNSSFGEWDYEVLANEWDEAQLEDWGVDFPSWDENEISLEENKEVDIDSFEENVTLKLVFSIEEYEVIKTGLMKIDNSPEIAIKKLLNI